MDQIAVRLNERIERELLFSVKPEQFDVPLVEVEGANYDSLRVLEMISIIEDEFGIEINLAEDDVQYNFRSMNLICRLIERKISAFPVG